MAIDCNTRGQAAASNRSPARWAACLLLIGVAALLVACGPRSDDETQLRQAVQEMRDALDQRDRRGFMRHVAADFTAGTQDMDRDGLDRFLRMQMLAHQDIKHVMGPLSTEITGDRATIRFPLTLAGGSQRLLPERAGQYVMTSGWRRVDGHWKCYHAQWERVL